jgi:hypothetical protein
MKGFRIAVIFLLMFSTFIKAGITISEYETNYKGKDIDFFNTYLIGLKEGINILNEYNNLYNLQITYCQPRQLSLNWKNCKLIIDEQIELQKTNLNYDPDVLTVSAVLLYGLIRTFPCED